MMRYWLVKKNKGTERKWTRKVWQHESKWTHLGIWCLKVCKRVSILLVITKPIGHPVKAEYRCQENPSKDQSLVGCNGKSSEILFSKYYVFPMIFYDLLNFLCPFYQILSASVIMRPHSAFCPCVKFVLPALTCQVPPPTLSRTTSDEQVIE